MTRVAVFVFFLSAAQHSSFAQVMVPDDGGSSITFKIKNFGSSVNGSFKGLKGTIAFDPVKFGEAAFNVSVNANTIDTGIGMRDNHLKKVEYFNATQFPVIRFISSSVSASTRPGEYIITGKLTIKNTTREISFPFTYSGGLFKGSFRINRQDFDVGGNSISLSDELNVSLSVAVKK